MTNYKKALDLAATIGWSYTVKWFQGDCSDAPDWWIYITRPGKDDYGAYVCWPPDDARNEKLAVRMMMCELGEGFARALWEHISE